MRIDGLEQIVVGFVLLVKESMRIHFGKFRYHIQVIICHGRIYQHLAHTLIAQQEGCRVINADNPAGSSSLSVRAMT